MPVFPPIADFEADEILVPLGETVDFTDLTLGVPDSWLWEFSYATPSSSEEQNPTDILFNLEGSFDVTLISSNELGTDTITKHNYITTSTTILPEVQFTVDKTLVCTGEELKLTDQSEYSPIQWLWEFDPPTVSFINGTTEESQHPEIIANGPMHYDVTLTVWNLNGSSQLTKDELILAGGYEPYYKETFEPGTFIMEDWTIENPDNDVTWEFYEVGGTSPGNTAAGIDFSNYFFIGERDRLISPPISLQGMTSAVLEFEHAYAQRNPNMTDSLIIYISEDCGNDWIKLLSAGEDGNGSLATHELTDGNFWPEVSDDWCLSGWGASCFAIDLTPWAGMADLRIAFETYSGFGNPLFIDNITISQYVGDNEGLLKPEEVAIFPNPTEGSFTIELMNPADFVSLSVVDRLGKEVYTRQLDGRQNRISVEKQQDWSPGMYFIRLSGPEESVLKKLIMY
jgi:PKD repeat protein